MSAYIIHDSYQDYFEYQGSTSVFHVRKQSGRVVMRKWIYFDSVEDAMGYFYSIADE